MHIRDKGGAGNDKESDESLNKLSGPSLELWFLMWANTLKSGFCLSSEHVESFRLSVLFQKVPCMKVRK